jgi:hypothetical protein
VKIIEVDKFISLFTIYNSKVKSCSEVLEWIEYYRLEKLNIWTKDDLELLNQIYLRKNDISCANPG